MTPTDEKQLVDAAVAGDQGALGELLDGCQQRIFNVCLRMLSNHDDALEIAQETMLKVVQHIEQFNGKSALSTWIIRIAMNLSLSALRKRKVRQSTSLDTTGTAPGASGASDDQLTGFKLQLADNREQNPAVSVEQDEMVVLLYEGLSRLTDDLRAVLVLRDIDDMNYQQIATVLTLPVGTVKSRLFRARLALRHEMMQLCPDKAAANPPSRA